MASSSAAFFACLLPAASHRSRRVQRELASGDVQNCCSDCGCCDIRYFGRSTGHRGKLHTQASFTCKLRPGLRSLQSLTSKTACCRQLLQTQECDGHRCSGHSGKLSVCCPGQCRSSIVNCPYHAVFTLLFNYVQAHAWISAVTWGIIIPLVILIAHSLRYITHASLRALTVTSA